VEELPQITVEIAVDKRDSSPTTKKQTEEPSKKISDLAIENIQKSQSQTASSPQEEYYNFNGLTQAFEISQVIPLYSAERLPKTGP